MTEHTPRITTALAEYDGITPSGLYINDPHGRRIATLRAGEDLATSVREELPPVCATIEAMAPVVAAARVLLGETHEGAWAPFAQAWSELETAVLAYDALTATASTHDAVGEGA